MTRTFRYPLRPTRSQAGVLTTWLGVCCDLYNAALQERRDAWRVARRSVSRLDQQSELAQLRASDSSFAETPSDIQRSAIRKVEVAFDAFFRRCKSGQKPGYPRFRSRRRYDSFSFPLPRINGNSVIIPKLGQVRFHRYRPIEGVPKHVTVGRDAGGRWFVSFACDLGEALPKIPVRTAVGIDLGLTTFATLSDGREVANPRWAREGAARIKRCQQAVARRRRGSESRGRARIAVARAHARVANQRKDFARKLACQLFRRYDLVAFEDLEVARMARGHFAKSISDAGWSVFLQALRDKAESAGRHAIAVDPRGTTQMCSGCGAPVPKGIGDRRHVCTCGVDLGRDHNAALNVLRLGRSLVETLMSGVVEAEGGLT